MNKHPLIGRKQSPEHIAKRVASVRKTTEAWSEEKRRDFSAKISAAMHNRPKKLREKFMYYNRGRIPWNKGKKCPQYSGENHWNWGNNMPQKSIEKMRKSLTGKKQSSEIIKKRFAWQDGYAHSPETKAKIGRANSGEGNGCWKGGISSEPYAPVWIDKRFKAGIRERDNNTCQNPDCRGTDKTLTVHHVDYDKKNCEPENLITLCRSCNGRANFNRDFWEAGYKEIIRMKYQADEQQIAV